MKAIYTRTFGTAPGPVITREMCFCRQCEFHFRRAISPLDQCPICGENVELTMQRRQDAERQKLADAPRVADETLNGTYRDVLTGELLTVSAASHTWEKRKIEYVSGILVGVVSFHHNWDIRHMIECRLLERIETGEPMGN